MWVGACRGCGGRVVTSRPPRHSPRTSPSLRVFPRIPPSAPDAGGGRPAPRGQKRPGAIRKPLGSIIVFPIDPAGSPRAYLCRVAASARALAQRPRAHWALFF